MQTHLTLTRAVLVSIAICCAGMANAQTEQERRSCSGDGATPDQRIVGCTAVIAARPAADVLLSAYRNRAFAFAVKGQFARALEDYDEAIRLAPNDSELFNNRGNVHRFNGDVDRALADLDQAIRLDPNNGRAYNNRGVAYRQKGDHTRAIADFTAAIRLLPNDANLHANRGVMYQVTGNYDLALADHEQALRLDPNLVVALYARGIAKIQKGDAAGGEADVAAATRIRADVARVFALRGGVEPVRR